MYLPTGESELAYHVARLSVATLASEPPAMTYSVAAVVVVVVVSISSLGASALSSQLSVDSSQDAVAAGVTRPLCVVKPPMGLTFVVFSLHKEGEYLRTL
jgi:hypothetical protein